MKREPPRPTFDTPSRTIVIEPVVPLEDPRDAVAAGEPPDPPERDDDPRTAPA